MNQSPSHISIIFVNLVVPLFSGLLAAWATLGLLGYFFPNFFADINWRLMLPVWAGVSVSSFLNNKRLQSLPVSWFNWMKLITVILMIAWYYWAIRPYNSALSSCVRTIATLTLLIFIPRIVARIEAWRQGRKSTV